MKKSKELRPDQLEGQLILFARCLKQWLEIAKSSRRKTTEPKTLRDQIRFVERNTYALLNPECWENE